MNISIALSVDSIIKNLLAQSALRHYMNDTRPGLLTCDQAPALRRLIRTRIADVALNLGAEVADMDSESDTVAMALITPAGVAAPSLRAMIEQTVGAGVAAAAYSAVDPTIAGFYTSLGNHTLQTLRHALCRPATITPCHW